jgi:hypothetical protein
MIKKLENRLEVNIFYVIYNIVRESPTNLIRPMNVQTYIGLFMMQAGSLDISNH